MEIESLWGIKVTVVVLNLTTFFTPLSLLPLYGTIKMSVLAHLIILKTAVAYMCILSLCRWSLEMQRSKAEYEDELVSGNFFSAFNDILIVLYHFTPSTVSTTQ